MEQTEKIAEYYSKAKKLSNGIKSQTKKRAEKLTKDILAALTLLDIKRFESISKLPDKSKEKVSELIKEFKDDIYSNLFNYVKASLDLSKQLNDDLGWEYISLSDNGVREYMERTFGDKTAKERININTNRLKMVVETYLLAEVLKGAIRSAQEVTNTVQKNIWNNISSPYTVPAIAKSVPASKIHHFGRGYATNGISQIYIVEQQMILGIFNEANYNSWKQLPGFKGWRTVVTSSNPCQFCIDESKFIHTILPQLPFHAHCLCIVIPVFD